MLRLDGVELRYGRVPAVRGLSLEVGRGELVGLIGSNGAGKSTTLLGIAGVLRPAAGSIALDGEPIDRLGPERVADRGVRLVPEGRHVFARLTVEENLRLGASGRRDRDAVEEDLRAQLQRFPVLDRLFKGNAGMLSGGEQQQLVIARALMARPRLLLLDEPSLGLSPVMVDHVLDAVAQLHADGMSIVLVEQLAERTVALADRTYVLKSGRAIAEGTGATLDRGDFQTAYLGEVSPA
jgi:branched-chain amino acid transport system ATP-binding protein